MNPGSLLRCGPGHYDFNMGLDEAVLEATTELGRPVLRFYSWIEPAASFGYFQKYADVERLTHLRPLVRRPTGGGIVPHDRDWTYSLSFPPSHEWYAIPAVESYRRVHSWLQMAFTALGLPTQLADSPLKTGPGQCFMGFEQYDLLWNGRKIAGAAQRRRRDGLLVQGSVQLPERAFERKHWEAAMAEAGEKLFGISWRPWEPDSRLVGRAQALAVSKYSRLSYNRRR